MTAGVLVSALDIYNNGLAQLLTVTLLGVDEAGYQRDVSVQIGVLVGDTNGDGVVNSADAQLTRNRSGQTTYGTNFRSDCNLDGSINSADALIVRARSGTNIPQ